MVAAGILVTSLILYVFIVNESSHVLSHTTRSARADPVRLALPLLLASVLLAAGASPAAAQCAMCKAAIEGSTDGAVGAQFNRAILVLMAAPYLVMGTFGVVLFRERLRRAARRLLGRRGAASAPAGPR